MKTGIRYLLLTGALVLCASCATNQSAGGYIEASEPSVTIRPALEEDIAQYGSFSNPYLTPDGLFSKSKERLAVYVVEISAPRGTRILMRSVDVVEGDSRFLDQTRFGEWWDLRRSFEQDDAIKRKTIARTYMPDIEFSARAGTTKRFIVLTYVNPLLTPIKVNMRIRVGSMEIEKEI